MNNVNLSIERGEIFGFLGSNGCGKSTTMKMLTGLLPASEGEARLFGKPIDAKSLETRMRVGYMTQAFSLYGELTVRQNLDLHARLYHLPPDQARERINELVEQVRAGAPPRRPGRAASPGPEAAALAGRRGAPRTRTC